MSRVPCGPWMKWSIRSVDLRRSLGTHTHTFLSPYLLTWWIEADVIYNLYLCVQESDAGEESAIQSGLRGSSECQLTGKRLSVSVCVCVWERGWHRLLESRRTPCGGVGYVLCQPGHRLIAARTNARAPSLIFIQTVINDLASPCRPARCSWQKL